MIGDKNQVLKFINGVPKNLEIVNTGSTFAEYGFDYKYFGKPGFNFALAPQPLSYDYKVLNQYKEHIKAGAVVVVVVVCPFVFCVTDYENDHANYKYYFFLKKDYINNYKKYKEILVKFCPVLLNPKQFIVKLTGYKRTVLPAEYSIKQMAEARINAWKRDFNLSDIKTAEPDKKIMKAFSETTNTLRKILDLCIENGFRPVIINMPACKEESGAFSEEFIERFYNINIKRANVYDVPVIDYFRDDRFNDPSLYINADCFNDKGREYFAKIFLEDLKKLGLWGTK